MTQTDFGTAVLSPDAPVPAGIIGPCGRPAIKRFGVYRNNVISGLSRALTDNFPALASLVGAEFFQAMAVEYVRSCPPASPCLSGYGLGMPQFLERFPAVSHLPYSPDIARLELALRDSYHAGDHDPQAGKVLADLAPDQLMSARLRFAPSARLVTSDWPVYDIWMAALHNGAKPRHEAQSVLIARAGFDPTPHLLDKGAPLFLRSLIDMASIGQAVNDHPSTDALAVLTLLATSGAIAEVLL